MDNWQNFPFLVKFRQFSFADELGLFYCIFNPEGFAHLWRY